MDWRAALAPEAAQAERASLLRHMYELLKRVDRSMADKDQRDLCQQTEMSLWGKAKSLDDYRRKIQLKCSKLEAAAQAAAAAAGSLQQQQPQQPAPPSVAAPVAYAAAPPAQQQQPAVVAPTGVYYAPPPQQPPRVPSVAAPPPRGVVVNGHGHHVQYQHPAAAPAQPPPSQRPMQPPYAVAPAVAAAHPSPQRPMQQQPYAVAPPGMPAKRKLEQTTMAAVGVAPVAAAAAAPVVGVVPVAAAAAAAAHPPEAKRARVDAPPSVRGAAAASQQPLQHGRAVAVAPAPAPEQRLPTRAEVVAPYLEDFRYFLQHVDGYQPRSHSATQVTGWRSFIQNLVDRACGPEASTTVNAKVQAGVQQAGTFARVYRKSHAEFLKRKQQQQQQQQQQEAMPTTVKKKEEGEGEDTLAAALAAELEGPIGQAGEQLQPSLNWAGLRQLVLETARASGEAGGGGGGKRAQALKNAPALITAALAARGLLSLHEGEGDGGGQGAVQRLRATVNAAMARLADGGGRLGQGMVEGLGLLARADVLLQELKGAYGGGGREREKEEEERLGAADPLALARFWAGVEGTAPQQPTVVVPGLAAWVAGLDAAAVDKGGGVGSAEALAAALRRADARFEEGKGPYRLEARGRAVLRVTHTAAAAEESSRLGRQEQQQGRWSGTEWAAELVLGKEKRGSTTTPAAAAAAAMVPVLVRVVVEGNAHSGWSRRAEAAAAGALLRWGVQEGGSSSSWGAVRTVAAVLEELRATLRPGVCGLTGRALAMDAGGGGGSGVELVTPYCAGGGGGRLAYSYCHY